MTGSNVSEKQSRTVSDTRACKYDSSHPMNWCYVAKFGKNEFNDWHAV